MSNFSTHFLSDFIHSQTTRDANSPTSVINNKEYFYSKVYTHTHTKMNITPAVSLISFVSLFLFWDGISQRSSDSLGTHSEDQTGLKLKRSTWLWPTRRWDGRHVPPCLVLCFHSLANDTKYELRRLKISCVALLSLAIFLKKNSDVLILSV